MMEMRYNHQKFNKKSSNKAFGLVMAGAFFVFSIFPFFNGKEPNYFLFSVSVVFLLVSFLYPRLLSPLNKVWYKLGLILHKIVNPLVMGILFFIVITPIALILRLCRFDMLSLKINKKKKTYWILRDKEPTTLEKQY